MVSWGCCCDGNSYRERAGSYEVTSWAGHSNRQDKSDSFCRMSRATFPISIREMWCTGRGRVYIYTRSTKCMELQRDASLTVTYCFRSDATIPELEVVRPVNRSNLFRRVNDSQINIAARIGLPHSFATNYFDASVGLRRLSRDPRSTGGF